MDAETRYVEIASKSSQEHFAKGDELVIIQMRIPEGATPGKYIYRIAETFNLQGGQIERTVVYESEPFFITKPDGRINGGEEKPEDVVTTETPTPTANSSNNTSE